MEEKAREKEQQYIQKLQNKLVNPDPVFVNLPGGLITLYDSVPCPDFNREGVSSKNGRLTIAKECPPVSINADSLIRNSTLFKNTLLDLQKASLSTQQEHANTSYLLSRVQILSNQNEQKGKALIWLSLGLFCCMAWIFRNPILKIFA